MVWHTFREAHILHVLMKILKNDEKRQGKWDSKNNFKPKRRGEFLALKIGQVKELSKTLTQMICIQFYYLFERSEVWKLVIIDKSETVSDDGYS